VIQRGTYTKEKVSSLVSKVLDDVLAILPEKERTKCFDFFSIMSPRYLLATPPPVIVRHVDLWDRFITEPIVFETRVLEKEGLNEVTLLTWEHRSLFPKMTGLFAAHNINILGAQLNLSSRGHALQIFQVNDPEGKIISDPEKWARVERDLRAVLPGQVKIETLVDEKFRPSLFKKKAARVLPSKVEIDNDISAYYTVIDIFTSDRLGLLYQIGSVLSALGLYVDVSKISTKVDQVADTFYVKDIFGHKITSEGRLKKIHDILEQVVSEAPTPGWRPPV
jgi:[protein-PII] uridylyltransferase